MFNIEDFFLISLTLFWQFLCNICNEMPCAGSFRESSAVNEWRHHQYRSAEFTELLDLFLTLCPTQSTSRNSCCSLILRLHTVFSKTFLYVWFICRRGKAGVYTQTHVSMHTHTHTNFLHKQCFKWTGEKARLRWKYQFLRYLALISDWYTVLYLMSF